MSIRYEVQKVIDLSESLLDKLSHQFDSEFGHLKKAWEKPGWDILAWDRTALVGWVGILVRKVKMADEEIELSGVFGVITEAEYRGKGIGAAMMRKAQEFTSSELGLEFSMLHCAHHLLPFYSKLGWQQIDNPVTCDQPNGKEPRTPVNMVLKCGQMEWPNGSVDLCGYPW
jgi:GNAT superfamily N-acetyltransferase